MLQDLDDVLAVVEKVYLKGSIPKHFLKLQSVRRIRAGEDPRVVARSVRSTAKHLQSLLEASDPIAATLGADLDSSREEVRLGRARAMLGQLLLGDLAERVFETIYKTTMGSHELALEDDRESRSETDYRVLNGQNRPVFRINIKFHGSLFRNARDLVDLDPLDCFALATYKIYQALQKQEREVLPYIFVIVGVPNLKGEEVGRIVPEDLAHLAALIQASRMPGKRDLEDRIVEHLIDEEQPEDVKRSIRGFYEQIDKAEWRVLSARKADMLLREKLFDRVFAVRVRAFARNYRNAELDMHFSLKEDLTLLKEFLALLKERGLHGLTAHLERGLV
ncbi:MAG: hypothetical protein ACRD1X_12025 [Vicinamibacteria bacterium]